MLGFILASGPVLSNWPQFRGSHGGNGTEGHFPLKWDRKTNVVWQADIPGRGWSSPIAWGDRIFLTAVQSDNPPEPRRGLYIKNMIGKVPPGEHRWLVLCLDWHSGKILWQKTVHKGIPPGTIHIKNSYASETPVTDGKRLIAYFGNLGLFCFDLEGKELWTKKLDPVRTRLGWGTGASPVLHKDRVYLQSDNEDNSYLLALDVQTGKEVWRVERQEKSSWSSPFIWENKLRTEIVTCASKRIRSYDLDGKLLWELGGMSTIVIPTPCAASDLLYLTSGYLVDTRRPLFAVRPGASGDISLKGNDTSNGFIAWSHKLAGPYHPSPVVYDQYIYVLYDRGMLACFEAATGKEMYKKRIDAGSDKFVASPVAADGKIFCTSEDGDTFVIKAGPTFQVLAKNSLDDMCLATPALVRNSILLRTMTKLVRIEEKQTEK
jgi:outer membrane protein assembly factor BamB